MSIRKMNTGQKIKHFRLLKGISKSELARQSGITFQSIYMIEEREQAPKIETLKKLAKPLKVKWEELA